MRYDDWLEIDTGTNKRPFFILDMTLLRFSVILVRLEIEQVKVPAFKITTS